ncbi:MULTISPECIES: Eco57I restriction-modification methylase domain-containing protein [Lysinibacillus]|uniref:site-specific DNA-methyltransferase (adenine-specific) n=1 Tax=Lysinibacillus xylanilyticus TaxID=582475 RepID=A0ABV3W512_9BACI
MKIEKYIKETVNLFKKKKHHNLESLKNYFLIYCISFCSNYLKLVEWEKNAEEIDFRKLKFEAMEKLNNSIFETLDLEDNNLLIYSKWLKENPPIYTTEDILGSVYMMFSEKEHRKKMGEHYTKNNLVEFIIKELGSYISVDKKIIDPACGSGNFLVRILSVLLSNGTYEENKILINKLMNEEFLVGIDIQEIPCLITKIRFLMEVVYYQKEIDSKIVFPIYRRDSLLETDELLADNQYDLVVSNPPFLRYQLIDLNTRKQLKDSYVSATGRFDLYPLFIEKSLKITKSNGKVVVLCSDKFMEAQYGKGIREFIEKNSQLSCVYDLSSIFPFKAAVLSAIYFFDKPLNPEPSIPANWFKVTQKLEGIKKEILGEVIYEEKWRYVNLKREKLLIKIQKNANLILNDIISEISVGLQTTFDDAFLKEMTKDFIIKNNFEMDFLKPLLRGRNLNKWNYKWSGLTKKVDTYVLYPYENINGKSIPINIDKFPNIEKYLLTYYKELNERTYFVNHSSKKWFEHWNARSFGLFEGVKILTPEISSSNRFSLDTQGYFYNGTVYGIKLKQEYDLNDYKYLLGILNSNLLNFVHKNLNSTHLQSKKYRYQASIMKKYPIVLYKDTPFYKKVISIVDKLLKESSKSEKLEEELNQLIYKLYKIDNNDQLIIEEFCKN